MNYDNTLSIGFEVDLRHEPLTADQTRIVELETTLAGIYGLLGVATNALNGPRESLRPQVALGQVIAARRLIQIASI